MNRSTPAIEVRDVSLRVDGATLLDRIDLEVAVGEHLAVLGPNGSGKTTLLRILSTFRHPTRGSVSILGARFGRADLRDLRSRVGFVSTALDDLLHVRAAALPLVAAAQRGGLWPPRDVLADPLVAAAAHRALERVGAGHLADRRVDTLSQGERQRVRIARALVGDPDLLLLDEPFAGLDLGGRESLLADLDALLVEPDGPTMVLVTHHLEELPRGTRSALLLRDGRVVAAGPVAEVLRDEPVSACFGLPVRVTSHVGRFTAQAIVGPDARPRGDVSKR